MEKNGWFLFSDLASERHGVLGNTEGISFEIEKRGCLSLEKLTVQTKEGAERIGRPVGHYQTVNLPDLETIDEGESAEGCDLIAEVLESLSAKTFGKMPEKVLVVGLGNKNLSADAVGPICAEGVLATGHLAKECPKLFSTLECTEIRVLCPGVSAQSGMDACDVVSAIAEKTKPDLVLIIDAYVARDTERLGTTVQISDTGIIPGGGVGNHRGEISRKTVGVPIFVIGVPTVTDSRIFVREEARKRGVDVPTWNEKEEPFFVCPKCVDRISEEAGKMISGAINQAFGIR